MFIQDVVLIPLLYAVMDIRYQSTLLGSFQTVELIETFMNYQVMASSFFFFSSFLLFLSHFGYV